jgi:hypothetical protein
LTFDFCKAAAITAKFLPEDLGSYRSVALQLHLPLLLSNPPHRRHYKATRVSIHTIEFQYRNRCTWVYPFFTLPWLAFFATVYKNVLSDLPAEGQCE